MKKLIASLIFLSALIPVWADEPVTGDWQGSGGRIFHVPSTTGSFSLTTTEPKGEKKQYQAKWLTAGESFTWIDAQKAKHTVMFEKGHKPVRFRDVGENYPDSPGYWYRKSK